MKKTRNASGSKLADYLGAGQELVASEVPTLRGALRKALLVQEHFTLECEVDKRNLPVKELMTITAKSVIDQWLKANHMFKVPVIKSETTLVRQLTTAWEKCMEIARGKANKPTRDLLEGKLDRLLDITVCRCPITLCSDTDSPCQNKVCKMPGGGHINCTCAKEIKLPLLDLAWLQSI